MKLHTLFSAILILAAFSSCKKTEIKDIEKAGGKLLGQWHVDAIETRTTDTTGKLLSTVTVTGQGTLLFASGDKDALGGVYFDHADFTGPCANSELITYFTTVAAGDRIADGWSLSWDADPEDLRVQFWGETGGGSYHRSINLSHDGGLQLFYVIQPQYQNKRMFYTWRLSN